jgi:type I restriction enzyme, S subunit
MSGELPQGWARCALAAVGKWGSGGTPSRATPESYGGHIPWLKIGDLSDGPVSTAEESITQRGLENSSAKLLSPNTLLVAMYGSIGKLGITTIACATNQAIAFCQPHDGLGLKYLFYVLMSERRKLIEQGQGGTQLNISQTILKAHEVPIAPTKEQARIVSRIEELFSAIEDGERALERVQKLVERYRQSVLKAAVTGELTRDWREKHKGSLESGKALLQRILAVRSKSRPRGGEPVAADLHDLGSPPEGWMWASLDSVADVVGGITVDKKRSAEGCDVVPYLRVANVQRGYLDLGEVKNIVAPRERIEQLRLVVGDVLFNEGGDLDKLGRGWIWEGQLPLCIHQNHVFRARLFVPGPWAKIVSWFGNVLGKQLFMDLGKQTTNLASLSLSKLKSFPVPLMCEQEANEIVSRVEDALSVIDRQISELATQRTSATALRQAVLKAAFVGELVPQHPTDEPASTLLARIAAEPPSSPPRRRSRRGV